MEAFPNSNESAGVSDDALGSPASRGIREDNTAADTWAVPPSTRKGDRERVRVSRACDRCKSKKIRCTGKKPCSLCIRLGIDCEWKAKYTRGRLPPVELAGGSPVSDPQVDMGNEEVHVTFNRPVTPANNEMDARNLLVSGSGSTLQHNPDIGSAAQSSRNSPEPSQTDLQGHYVGPSSGVSFLLRAQKRLHKIVSLSPNASIFTFGDRDTRLQEFDSSFFVLPPKEKAKLLVARYFDFAVPTHRFLHRQTVEGWLEDLYSNLGIRERQGDRGKRAVTFMVFAQALEYMPKEYDSQVSDSSVRYFQAAEHQLRAETGAIRLTSVQARLCQCFWLLSESRINHCWSLFGTTAHLMLALGIHRKRRRETSSGFDLIDIECRKRVFWSAYTLDKYLSAALGRPRAFHDDDIDQELPALLDDTQLRSGSIHPIPASSKTQSIMLAPIYHARLAQIISGILKDLYGIRPVRSEVRAAMAKQHTDELRKWRQGIGHFLDVNSSLLNELFQRQSNVLRLAYAHALILVHRPFLLSNFADLTRRSYASRLVGNPVRTEESIAECLKAAMSIVGIVCDLCESGQNFRAFWFTHYYAFCAVVVLYVYTIQRHGDAPSTWQEYFAAAEKCQAQLSSLKGEKDSFAQRYSIVLEELRLEAVKQTKRQPSSSTNNAATDADRERETEVAHTILRLGDKSHLDSYTIPPDTPPNTGSIADSGSLPLNIPQHQLGPVFDTFNSIQQLSGDNFGFPTGTSPASFTGDATGWGEFDSFVTAGIGGLEANYFNGMDSMSVDEQWFSSGMDTGNNSI